MYMQTFTISTLLGALFFVLAIVLILFVTYLRIRHDRANEPCHKQVLLILCFSVLHTFSAGLS